MIFPLCLQTAVLQYGSLPKFKSEDPSRLQPSSKTAMSAFTTETFSVDVAEVVWCALHVGFV